MHVICTTIILFVVCSTLSLSVEASHHKRYEDGHVVDLFDVSQANDLIHQITARRRSKAEALINTTTYTSLNLYQWDLAFNNLVKDSNYGNRAEAYCHFRLWDQRLSPGYAGGVGILASRKDVPHKWAYPKDCLTPGVENLLPKNPYLVLPYEQGRCDVELPQIVQGKSGDPVDYVRF